MNGGLLETVHGQHKASLYRLEIGLSKSTMNSHLHFERIDIEMFVRNWEGIFKIVSSSHRLSSNTNTNSSDMLYLHTAIQTNQIQITGIGLDFKLNWVNFSEPKLTWFDFKFIAQRSRVDPNQRKNL